MKEKVSTVMGVVMPLMLAVLLVMNIFTLLKVNDVQSFINKKNGDGDVAQENDVTICDQYVIKDTTAISDAYKSGSTSGLSDKEKETLDLAKNVLDDIITDGMNDYEKELAVYDWMTKNLTFDSGSLLVVPESGSDCDNPYGVLKHHDAVCVGYATTFRLFMQMMDIECMVVHNSDLSHSWDLVKLDGHCYHTDIYSDEGTGNYMSFNVNDSIWSQRQEWNKDFFPAADGKDKYKVFFGGNYGQVVIKGGCDNGKTLLIIKDSFANSLAPFLTADYETIIMLDLRYSTGSAQSVIDENNVDDILFIQEMRSFSNDKSLIKLTF